MRAPTAKSLVLDLLSTLPAGSAMPARAVVAAGTPFGLAENNVRVALARLLRARRIARDERGHYRLGAAGETIAREVAAWRTLAARSRSWTGGWIGVHTAALPRADRARLRRRGRALAFLGFRELAPGLAVRPDNLAGGVDGVRARLQALGLETAAPVFELRGLDPETEQRARSLWDVAALRAGYRRMRADLAASERRLAALPAPNAMAESFTLGGEAIRRLVLDPLLPEPIVPAAERDALLDAMRRYDRLGRDVWAGFLAAFGVPHRRTPADLRMAAPGLHGSAAERGAA